MQGRCLGRPPSHQPHLEGVKSSIPSRPPQTPVPTTSVGGGGGELLGGAHSVLPAPAASINRLGTALDNLALTAANNTTVLQQLTAANLALTTSNAMLTAANKKLSEALAKVPTTTPRTPGTPRPPNKGKPFHGNYCWTHGHRISQLHTSATCGNKAEGHKDAAMASNTLRGSKTNKGWNTRCT
jgi:hypothetical protein